MTDNLNYDHLMSFKKLHQHQFNNQAAPTDSLASGTSLLSTFGPHWKKVESFKMGKPNDCDQTRIPSEPATLSSSTLSTKYFVGPSMETFHTSSDESTKKESTESSSDSSSSNGSYGTTSSLFEHTEKREIKQCLELQMEGMGELNATLIRCNEETAESVRQQTLECNRIIESGKLQWNTFEQYEECIKETIEDGMTGYENRKTEQFYDTLHQAMKNLRAKDEVEKFVRRYEELYDSSNNVLPIIAKDQQRIARIYQILNRDQAETAPLTTRELQAHRSEQVYQGLVKMVRGLHLDETEHERIGSTIQVIEQNKTLGGISKCGMLFQQLFETMSTWGKTSKSVSSFDSEDWKSVGSFDSGNYQLGNVNSFESSSFALTNPITFDSNLSDLEGELRSARIRKAVEGPKQVYECGAWTDGSNFSQWSATSNSVLSIQPLGGSNNSTVLPKAEHSTEQLATALSPCDQMIPRPPRSVDGKSIQQSCTGTGTYSDPYDFSDASLKDILDETLKTARDDLDSHSLSLLSALENSTQKDGFDLVTAISSSSECLSDTQSSHSTFIH